MSYEDLQEQNDKLLEMLKWNTAAMVAILSNFNNKITIARELLEDVNLGKQAVRISLDEEANQYVVEGVEIAL